MGATPDGPGGSGPIRVLLVDDSPLFVEEILQFLEGDPLLEPAGVARNGQQAVEMTERLCPDLILMDIQMPVMDGLQAIETIMANRPTPILAMTSNPRGRSGELALEATRRGALDLVSKQAYSAASPAREMASDGAEGLRAIRKAGGRTLAQDDRSALIPAMPQAAWALGGVERLVPLEAMGAAILRIVGTTGSCANGLG